MSSAAIASVWPAVSSAAALLGPPLVLTLGIEVPVAALMGLRGSRALSAVALVSLVTNPALNLALASLGVLTGGLVAFSVAVAVLEALVVIAEWRLLLWVLGGPSRKMLLVSATMNAASFGAGIAYSWIPGIASG